MMIEGEKLPTIPARRVELRWLEERDVDALYAIFSEPEVMRYWSRPPMTSRDEAKALLDEIHSLFRDRTLFQWGISREGLVVGTCTLFNFDPRNRRAEIGYALGREHWGHGYANEAVSAVIDYAFDELALHRIEADVDPRNAASIRALERLGFVREGYLRERWHVGGEIQDALFYGLLRSDWEKKEASTDV